MKLNEGFVKVSRRKNEWQIKEKWRKSDGKVTSEGLVKEKWIYIYIYIYIYNFYHTCTLHVTDIPNSPLSANASWSSSTRACRTSRQPEISGSVHRLSKGMSAFRINVGPTLCAIGVEILFAKWSRLARRRRLSSNNGYIKRGAYFLYLLSSWYLSSRQIDTLLIETTEQAYLWKCKKLYKIWKSWKA